MFKVGQDVVLNNSSQNKVMKIQAYKDEFIRAYWSKKEYSFAQTEKFTQNIATENAIYQNGMRMILQLKVLEFIEYTFH